MKPVTFIRIHMMYGDLKNITTTTVALIRLLKYTLFLIYIYEMFNVSGCYKMRSEGFTTFNANAGEAKQNRKNQSYDLGRGRIYYITRFESSLLLNIDRREIHPLELSEPL